MTPTAVTPRCRPSRSTRRRGARRTWWVFVLAVSCGSPSRVFPPTHPPSEPQELVAREVDRLELLDARWRDAPPPDATRGAPSPVRTPAEFRRHWAPPFLVLSAPELDARPLDLANLISDLGEVTRDWLRFLDRPLTPGLDSAPLSVLRLRDATAYLAYGAITVGGFPPRQVAHAEGSERLVIHGMTVRRTLRHEGVHLLMAATARRLAAHEIRSFWFHEGLAEWLAGAPDDADPSGPCIHGRLTPDLFATLETATNQGETFELRELVGCGLFAQRVFLQTAPRRVDALIAQSTILVHFLATVSIRDDRVDFRVDAPPRHLSALRAYASAEMEGRSGPSTFFEVFGRAELDELEDTFASYQRLVVEKARRRGELVDGRLVPSSQRDGDVLSR